MASPSILDRLKNAGGEAVTEGKSALTTSGMVGLGVAAVGALIMATVPFVGWLVGGAMMLGGFGLASVGGVFKTMWEGVKTVGNMVTGKAGASMSNLVKAGGTLACGIGAVLCAVSGVGLLPALALGVLGPAVISSVVGFAKGMFNGEGAQEVAAERELGARRREANEYRQALMQRQLHMTQGGPAPTAGQFQGMGQGQGQGMGIG